jgi:hypothetical protein
MKRVCNKNVKQVAAAAEITKTRRNELYSNIS